MSYRTLPLTNRLAKLRKLIFPVSLLLTCLLATMTTLKAAEKFTGYFPDVAPLKDFKRGVTTAEEVIEILGKPVGSGSSILPPDYRQRDIYYYEQINIADMSNQRSSVGTTYIYIEMEQKILAVLILDGKFDSFMWFSNDLSGEGLATP
jgi:outer membrane protein assembly factor BamE (lipoprotein component of BamABCDE complex)